MLYICNYRCKQKHQLFAFSKDFPSLICKAKRQTIKKTMTKKCDSLKMVSPQSLQIYSSIYSAREMPKEFTYTLIYLYLKIGMPVSIFFLKSAHSMLSQISSSSSILPPSYPYLQKGYTFSLKTKFNTYFLHEVFLVFPRQERKFLSSLTQRILYHSQLLSYSHYYCIQTLYLSICPI